MFNTKSHKYTIFSYPHMNNKIKIHLNLNIIIFSIKQKSKHFIKFTKIKNHKTQYTYFYRLVMI